MNTAIVVALIAVVPPTVIGLMSFFSSRKNATRIGEIHVSINSRLDKLLEATQKVSFREGEKAAEDKANADAATFAAGEKAAKDKAEGIK